MRVLDSVGRIAFDGLCILSIALAPWWVTLGLAALGLSLYAAYYEVVVWGIMIDVLYGVPYGTAWWVPSATVASVALLFVFSALRSRMRM